MTDREVRGGDVPDGHSLDAFHRGRFVLVQPKRGHRAGMDALVLAAALPSDFSGRVADLGAGAGAAGLAVLSRCPAATAVLVENAPEMLDCAQLTLAHPTNTDVANRAELLAADVTLSGKARAEAGLADNSFDFVIMNPPFNDPGDRESPDPLRRRAHVMGEGLIEAWVRSAAAITKPRGRLAAITRPESLADLLTALEGRFGKAELLPIHPRPGKAAIRVVVRATLGSRAALRIMPPLILHDEASNRFSARADAICNGLISLFGD